MELVSIVIPTKNSGMTLERCLHSLLGQTYTNLEIMVVDNHSTDATVEIANRFGIPVLIEGKERSEQVNAGAKFAKGDFIMRTDGDFVFDPTLISDAVRMSKKGFDAVTVHGTSDDTISWLARARKAERDSYKYDWHQTAPCFFNRDVFIKVQGFKGIANEEYDLKERLLRKGYKIGYIDAKAIHLGEPKSLADCIPKYRYYGGFIDEFLRNNLTKGGWQIAPIRLAWFRNLKNFGILFYPFIVYKLVSYESALVGLIEKRLKKSGVPCIRKAVE